MSEPLHHNTLPPRARIRSGSTFRRIFALRWRSSDHLLTLYTAPNNCGFNRLGLSVSRNFGNAVSRNRIKRLIREAFRHLRHELPGPADWVVIPKPGQSPSLSDLKHSIRKLSRRLDRNRAIDPDNRSLGRKASPGYPFDN